MIRMKLIFIMKSKNKNNKDNTNKLTDQMKITSMKTMIIKHHLNFILFTE